RIFLGSTLLVVTVLGTSLGITAHTATRTADAAIERALAGTRRAIANLLATRTRTLAEMSAVSAGAPQFREGLSASRERADILHPAEASRAPGRALRRLRVGRLDGPGDQAGHNQRRRPVRAGYAGPGLRRRHHAAARGGWAVPA